MTEKTLPEFSSLVELRDYVAKLKPAEREALRVEIFRATERLVNALAKK